MDPNGASPNPPRRSALQRRCLELPEISDNSVRLTAQLPARYIPVFSRVCIASTLSASSLCAKDRAAYAMSSGASDDAQRRINMLWVCIRQHVRFLSHKVCFLETHISSSRSLC